MSQALARHHYASSRQARFLEEENRSRQSRREALEEKRRQRVTLRGCACLAAAGALMFGLFFLVAWLNISTTQKGYDCKRLEKGIAEERMRHEELRLEVARLESPARVERIATEQLGMVLPIRSELLRLPAAAPEAAAADGGAGASGSLGRTAVPGWEGGVRQ